MRITTLLLACSLLTSLAVSARAADTAPATDLLADGLAGWNFFVVEPDVKLQEVWTVDDGVLKCKGQPLGYLSTKQKFTNFKLTLEWRWAGGGEGGNSGVLLRIAGKPITFLPKCLECQLKAGSAGDVWGFYGFKLKGDPARAREVKGNQQLGDFSGVGLIEANEKPPGQWNRYDITLQGGRLTVLVNGKKVNEAHDCELLEGPIGLQSEGGEIHFRNLRLTELPAE